MNILVVGNGFDLAHGLKTSYKDFIEIVIELRKSSFSLYKMSEDIKTYISDDNIYFKEFKDLIRDNVWIKYFENEYLKKEIGNKWVDFEAEISTIIQLIDYFRNGKGRLAENRGFSDEEAIWFKKIKVFIKKRESAPLYIAEDNKLIEDLELDLSRLIRALEIYLSLFVDNAEIQEVMNISNIDKVISFNYTNTYQRLYDKDNKVEYDYIHGKVNIDNKIEDNNMVLGIDEYLDEKRRDKELDFIFFKKYFQRIYKKTGCKYKRWLEEIKQDSSDIHNIYIFGHSLAKSDKDILRDLILFENTKITIYYHSKEAYRNQITNLVDIITQDKLIEMVYGNNPKIEFISTENKSEFEVKGYQDKYYPFKAEAWIY